MDTFSSSLQSSDNRNSAIDTSVMSAFDCTFLSPTVIGQNTNQKKSKAANRQADESMNSGEEQSPLLIGPGAPVKLVPEGIRLMSNTFGGS